LAIAPPNEDAFLREVDDNLRHDRMVGLARRYGRIAVIVVGALLVLLALGLWWRSYREKQAGGDSEQLVVALAPAGAGGAPDAAALGTLAQSSRKGYRYAALLAQAGEAQRTGDAKGAAGKYEAIAADTGAPQAYRDLATVRAVAAGFDTLPPQTVIARLKPLAIAGNPYFPSAAELTAAAWIKDKHPERAGPLFAAIARDPQAPASLRGRAAGMATALGQAIADPAAPATTLAR
jgi:hypothetical protein